MAGRRRAAAEVVRRGKRLTDDSRSDQLPVAADQLTVRFVWKHQLSKCRDDQRIADAQQHRRDGRHEKCDEEISSEVHRRRRYTSRNAVTRTSIALMPTNGTMTPPTP